jgi:hypothetical protein
MKHLKLCLWKTALRTRQHLKAHWFQNCNALNNGLSPNELRLLSRFYCTLSFYACKLSLVRLSDTPECCLPAGSALHEEKEYEKKKKKLSKTETYRVSCLLANKCIVVSQQRLLAKAREYTECRVLLADEAPAPARHADDARAPFNEALGGKKRFLYLYCGLKSDRDLHGGRNILLRYPCIVSLSPLRPSARCGRHPS